ITISASTYMILYSHLLYERLSPWLGVFERKRPYREEAQERHGDDNGVDVILFGLGRFGAGIGRELRQRGYRVLGVDFDPNLIRRQASNDYEVRYGDAEDPEFLASLPLGQVRWVLSSLREMPVNLALLHGLRDQGYKGRVAVTAHASVNAGQLKQAGADRVLMPYAAAAAEAVDSLFGMDGGRANRDEREAQR
ncbi:MAG TPA: sodium:proton exchanger, partial [Gammaproteobacteria bacterium]|nr:sodium:proton exchanger [Gammaproteobacteria bacterium]